MRDSFGGVFTMRILLVFIFIFVSFSAVSFNYAKSFRLKNKVISFIEENEIIELYSSNFDDNLPKLEAILKETNYNKTCTGGNGNIETPTGYDSGYCYNGIVILKENRDRK